ncbi:hypothetical protein PS850_04820 [Pseudomonas fluorescens]|nr:hypothetical protein PS850_04820 [Pseudomonas fluorescens]
MDKLKMHSPNLTDANIDKLAILFPNCISEALDAKGQLQKTIDFDLLRQELSSSIVEGPQERYQLNWPGKREALLTANAPIAKTLRPIREESVDFETTQNLFIEGDNLEALKLLQETYLNKVKMIFIDPPYNTGNDFVYADNFAESAESYFERSSQADDSGGRLIANLETSGRFHSDWLSMMYSRLRLARTLMCDEAVIFISIGDDEVGNLIKICDEVFGEENFVANFIWEKRTNRENRKVVSSRHDYVVCYCRNQVSGRRAVKQLPMTEKALANYKNPDNDSRGLWKSDPATAQAGHGTKSQFYTLKAPNGKEHVLESGRCWLYTEKVMQEAIDDGRIWFGREGHGVPRIKTYLEAKERGLTPESILFAAEVSTNEISKNQLKELFDGKSVFETPKPVDLIKMLVQLSSEEGIILDFFSGSSSTAHAVMELNSEDGGNRRFIMVQLQEACDIQSEAYKQGYGNIAEIGKERIRRAGNKIKQESVGKEGVNHLDTGFRVLKVDTSNMKEVYYTPDAVSQDLLSDQVDNIREDRTAEDLLFQVLLDWGVDLALPISQQIIAGKTVFFIDGNALVACFDTDIDEDFVKQVARHKPLRVVFRDAGFASDSVKINVEQVFKLLSPATEVKTL